MATNRQDLEKGLPAPPNVSNRTSTITATNNPDALMSGGGPGTHLYTFQVLIGIKNGCLGAAPNRRATLHIKNLLAPPQSISRNLGLYQRAISEEWKNRLAYMCSMLIIDCLYLIQILLAATFTALSAYQDMHSSVSLTVLGAINTVIAGILAWLKGQGMPNRFRKARDSYQAIVKSIEMTERLFAEYDQIPQETKEAVLDPRIECAKLERMFEAARKEQQANYPDMYVSSSDHQETEDLKEKINVLEALVKKDGGVERSLSVVAQ